MKKHSILFIPLAMLLFTTTNCMYSSASTPNPVVCVSGSGNAISENRPVEGFSSVSVEVAGNLIVEQGETESLTIIADDNLLPLLTSEVRDSRLILTTNANCIQPTSNITYRVTVKNLNAVEISGDVTVDLQNINTDLLDISADGTSRFTASGKADQLKISASGTLIFNGENLSSTAAKADISGSARAVIQVNDTLDVNIQGVGSVDYIGNPTVTKNIQGIGSVRQRS
ncbi:MAG: DUF2807 domain-containing protein [Stigonema ocellatum SAG 48.90 = DSM 106950]|nr:DUF2807 domain-containing protein [Stigonema ocellatum SAG 48.90 = DSM 106950]